MERCWGAHPHPHRPPPLCRFHSGTCSSKRVTVTSMPNVPQWGPSCPHQETLPVGDSGPSDGYMAGPLSSLSNVVMDKSGLTHLGPCCPYFKGTKTGQVECAEVDWTPAWGPSTFSPQPCLHVRVSVHTFPPPEAVDTWPMQPSHSAHPQWSSCACLYPTQQQGPRSAPLGLCCLQLAINQKHPRTQDWWASWSDRQPCWLGQEAASLLC